MSTCARDLAGWAPRQVNNLASQQWYRGPTVEATGDRQRRTHAWNKPKATHLSFLLILVLASNTGGIQLSFAQANSGGDRSIPRSSGSSFATAGAFLIALLPSFLASFLPCEAARALNSALARALIMTSKNFTIDNINPLIQYSPPGAWTEGSKTLDPEASSYSNGGTFTLCTTQGSSATFVFNGTQVYVFGARRGNHGPYSITLDGTQTLFQGFASPDVFSTLFVSDVLPQGQHTVTVTNELNDPNKPFLDIDFITWTSNVPDNGDSKTLEDTADAFTYTPPTSWTTDLSGSQLTGFSGNNGHATLTTGASATISFSGGFISVFGPVGPTIARYSVVLDGVNVGTFNATKQAYTPQVALYQATGLGAGQHTLQLVSQPAVGGQILAIDYVQVSPNSTAKAGGGSQSATDPTGSGTATPKKSSSVGPAVGGAVGGIVVLAILIFLIFFLCRRRRRREQDPNQTVALEDKYAAVPAPTPYAMGGTAAPSHYSVASAGGSQSHLVLQQPAQYGAVPPPMPSPPFTNPYSGIESPPLNNPGWNGSHGDTRRTFYTVNDDPTSGTLSRTSMSDGVSSVGRSSTVHSSGAAGLGAGGGNMRRSKGGPLPLPPTANVPLPPDAPRMYIPGREQDMGPLPPDYEQATEPYRAS
ncbi:hypothetical protein MVEN_01671100 [Mycena venus]|uniref:Transmembrane protein n=1 Tax=Mycena venus TaxID=2733690 RepID=A0A8H6XR50_9AGAR|nr:hypothetical protein MVEN_01671100 [Mycena venus]